ncbi:MAG: hypothetical protein QOC63_1099 [Mycobacterium sp.]|nr:hypothetical protein [Mycobacterium sp.]
MSDTVLDRLVACLNAALEYNTNAQVPPVALLWPDECVQWQSVIDRIAARVPVVSLGDYDLAARRGPAYWLRCVVAGTVDAGLMDGTPIVYLPGVARSALRAADSCPASRAPIAELQYRGQWFSRPNCRDWSVRALLSNAERGLGLRVADDAKTSGALHLALYQLLDERVEELAQHLLDADFLHELVNPDPVHSLLGWLDNPIGFRPRLDETQWSAFVQQCKADHGFNPTLHGQVTAARKLGRRQGKWAQVWKRYAETPERYPGIPDQLRKARPEQLIVEDLDVWPQDNEMAEDQLRSRLRDFEALTAAGARKEVLRLDDEHAWRRSTVWADLDQAPLAFALEQLVVLSELTAQPLASDDLAALRADYVERGWRVDDAVLRSLALARSSPDRAAVTAAAATMYRPWLDAGAKALQTAIGPMANAHTYEAGLPASTATGSVTVFVDGLRLDIAHRVQDRLAAVGCDVDATTAFSALPTVTQTAKPALVPVAKGALVAGPDLHPVHSITGTKASIQVLRSLMVEHGVQVLGPADTGEPSGTAWTEAGEIDHRGHDRGIRLVDYLDEETHQIVSRIRELLEAGWQRVDVVTDHGWILLPGGMEKVNLPPASAEIKKGRCARLKEGAVVETPTVPWFWDPNVRIALAPGVACFEAGKEYEHGGVSPQECIVPRLTITAGAAPTTTGGPEITKVKWLGLLCRIELTGICRDVVADLRALPADPDTSIAEEAKETSSAGRISLVVPDEDHEGEHAHLVLVAADGQILAQREVVVGKNK